MKFTVITKYRIETVEADDIRDAIEAGYDNHNGYDLILAVARVEEADE